MSKELLINKPQINPEVFKVGIPIHVHMELPHTGTFNQCCIISRVEPFYIKVSYYDHKKQEMDWKTIHMEWIQQDTTKITILDYPSNTPAFRY